MAFFGTLLGSCGHSTNEGDGWASFLGTVDSRIHVANAGAGANASPGAPVRLGLRTPPAFSSPEAVFESQAISEHVPLTGTGPQLLSLIRYPIRDETDLSLASALKSPLKTTAVPHVTLAAPIQGGSKYTDAVWSSSESGAPSTLSDIVEVTSADAALYASVPFGKTPKNGFFFLNNVFGKGNFVNGVDYSQKLSAISATFPNNALIEWSWPDETSGSGFAYSYPEIIYGGTPHGNPFRSLGPWPHRVSDVTTLRVNYDIVLGGNTNSFDVLLDVYLTSSPTSTDGSYLAEISFYPHLSDPHDLHPIHQFSWGRAAVVQMGKEILIRPVGFDGKPRDLLTASIDIKEILDHLKWLGLISGKEYLRGAEFGVEVQVPNSYNSAPHRGFMHVNSLSYIWN